MVVVSWAALAGTEFTEQHLLDGCLLPQHPLADVLVQSYEAIKPDSSKKLKAADELGLPDLLARLENTDIAQMPQLLLSITHVVGSVKGQVLAPALASKDGKALWNSLAAVHDRSADLSSMPSQMVVTVVWAVATVCEVIQEQGPASGDARTVSNQLGSHSGLLNLLISHVVFLASNPEHMFTRRGLITLIRALRVLFSFQTKDLPCKSSVIALCKSADVAGRALQVLEYQPAQHLPCPDLPLNADKGQSAGELYIQTLAAALTYIGFSSGIFSAPGGQLVLDAAASRGAGGWLMSHGRLLALRTAFDTLTQVLYRNTLLDHVECPETRQVDTTLRNLLLMLTLPLCCSKRQQDLVEMVSLSLQLYQMLYRLDFLPLFTRMLHASHPPEVPDETQPPALYYQSGFLQPYFSMVAGVMCDALPIIGASMSDLDNATPEQTDDMKAFIEQNIPRIIVWSDMLLAAIQQSQQGPSNSGPRLQYRPATAELAPEEAEAAANGLVSKRRCACCGSRPSKLLTCKKCGTAVYCGRDCQVQHWALVHKQQCKHMQSSLPAPAS